LAAQTLKVLEGLKEPVKVYAFYQEADPSRTAAEDLFNLYKLHSGKRFDWEFVDPDRFPMKAQQFKVNTYNAIVVELGDRFEKAFMAEEEKITNALVKVTRKEKQVVYVLQGHGEHGLENVQKDGYSEAKKALETENYEVKPLLLTREASVPADATLVLLGGPQKAPQEEELQSLRSYVDGGGKALILVDPQTASGVEEFLGGYGILLDQDIIVDRNSRLLGGDYLVPPIVEYESHPITRDFRQSSYLAYLPMARSVRPAEKSPDGVSVEVLARTGPGSWGEKDVERLKKGEAELGPEDIQGPVPVAVVASVRTGEGKGMGRMVVIGDSDFISNAAIDPNRSANQDLFLNAANWLAEQEDLISIRAKSAPSKPIMLRPGQWTLVFLLVVVAFPLAILCVGVGVLWRRRGKK
jgi:ABC-type uncharacterized transport system involved in gliding motility auxiliary subunit